MATTVNMHEAKTHLSKLVERAAKGEEIIIAKAGKPQARLIPVEPQVPHKRKFGSMKGQLWISPDFDAPIPELERAFLESKILPDEPAD